jgi:hypothetical protein
MDSKLEHISFQKQLFFERMDAVYAKRVMAFYVYDCPEGYVSFCEQSQVPSCFSTAAVSGETTIGLFATAFVDGCRDEVASNYSPVRDPS